MCPRPTPALSILLPQIVSGAHRNLSPRWILSPGAVVKMHFTSVRARSAHQSVTCYLLLLRGFTGYKHSISLTSFPFIYVFIFILGLCSSLNAAWLHTPNHVSQTVPVTLHQRAPQYKAFSTPSSSPHTESCTGEPALIQSHVAVCGLDASC